MRSVGWMTMACTLCALHGRDAAAAPESDYDKELESAYEEADAIADDYETGDAKAYREATLLQLVSLRHRNRDQLVAALDGYIEVAAERGAQGLEGVIASTTAALAHRRAEGWLLAEQRMADFAEVYWFDEDRVRPAAYIPLERANQPAIHYVATPLARGILDGFTRGSLDPDAAIQDDLCSEAGIAAFEQRWGAQYADVLAQMCEDIGSGGSGGGLGLGPLAEASAIDCLTDHEPTRAERVEAAMLDCFESVASGGGGNPFASGSIADILRDYGSNFPRTPEPEAGTDYDGTPVTMYEFKHEDGTTTFLEFQGGAVSRIEVDTNGETIVRVDYDSEGHMMGGIVYEDDVPTESVQINADNSYSVTHYDDDGDVTDVQNYDADGNPIDAMGNPVAASPGDPGMDWGETAECRELTLTLMFEKADALLESAGISPTVVNPVPDGPVEDAGDDDCFGLSAVESTDDSFACGDDVKLCPAWQAPDDECGCETIVGGMTVADLCGLAMLCDGTPKFVDGACTCTDETILLDDAGAPGPLPLPIDLHGHPAGD